MKQASRSLRVSLHQPSFVRVMASAMLLLTASVMSDQKAAAQVTSGWIDDGQVVRLENPIDRVGIGTTSPRRKLHVAGDAAKNASDGSWRLPEELLRRWE